MSHTHRNAHRYTVEKGQIVFPGKWRTQTVNCFVDHYCHHRLPEQK